MKKKIRRFLIKIFKKILKFVQDIRRQHLYYHRWPRLYKKYSQRPIDEKKVVLAYAGHYKQMPDNLVAIKEYLEPLGYNCVVIDTSDADHMCKNRYLNQIMRFFYGKEFFEAYGNARALFLTDYFFPAFAVQPREGQSVVQLWHGCGAFKKWGYSTAEKKWGASKESLDKYPIHNTYTHVCVSSPKVKFAYAEAFGCSEENIFALGAPRTDVYFDEAFVSSCREKVLEQFPKIGNRKIILYAPTFRGNSIKKSYMKNKLDIEKMREELGDEYALVVKLHPLTAKGFKVNPEDDFVFNASKCISIDTALCAADTVITDYSSLVFEYALLERPMIFFAYDLASYDDSRSFYFDYETFVPGEIVVDTDEIIAEIKHLETDFDVERVRRFKDDFMSACDGNCTRKIAQAVLGIKTEK